MKHTIIVKCDMRDADYTSNSFVVYGDEDPFKDWALDTPSNTTWHTILQAFSQCLKEYEDITKGASSNWNQTARSIILNNLSEKLKIPTIDEEALEELLYDLIPGSYSYPVHKIKSIITIPFDNATIYF